MWLPVGLVGDGQVGQPGAVIIHDVVRAVCWTHDLQETQTRRASHTGGKKIDLIDSLIHGFLLLLILARPQNVKESFKKFWIQN